MPASFALAQKPPSPRKAKKAVPSSGALHPVDAMALSRGHEAVQRKKKAKQSASSSQPSKPFSSTAITILDDPSENDLVWIAPLTLPLSLQSSKQYKTHRKGLLPLPNPGIDKSSGKRQR
ncbi:hypothetical protein OIU85_013062 [Salix viminalis]|uniref:Uncharacterized protein n=1 Tax=Salix viminalis TaxID=40686 RepID=A0A9Q0NQJ6_SALVM|nr:hypothetical protein OIU85_013062 [Salix viminalis]